MTTLAPLLLTPDLIDTPTRLHLPIGEDPHPVDKPETTVWDLDTDTTTPHLLAVGPSGTGVSTLLRTLALGATRRGCDVVGFATGGLPGLWDLHRWPGVRAITAIADDHSRLLQDLGGEYARRHTEVLHGLDRSALRPLVVLVDNLHLLQLALVRWWREDLARKGSPPCLDGLWHLLHLGRSVRIHLAIGTPTLDTVLTGSAVDQLRTRIVLGPLDRSTAARLFDAPNTRIDNDLPGRGWARDDRGLPRATQVYAAPERLDADISDASYALVQALQPDPFPSGLRTDIAVPAPLD